MIELKLPTTNMVEVPFAPNMPVEKGERKEAPSLEKRVLVGTPLVLQLIKKTGGISWLAFRFAQRVFLARKHPRVGKYGDEHAIKFTEAWLREYALNPKAVYVLAARHATDVRLRRT